MNSAVVNVKVNPDVKKKAQQVAQNLGLTLSALINGYLKHLVKTQTVYFDLREEPSEYLLACIKEAQKDIKNKKTISFKNPKDALTYLDNIIDNEQKSKKN